MKSRTHSEPIRPPEPVTIVVGMSAKVNHESARPA
jgi:hypothetical protein